MPIMVERASNADRARYVLRTSPSAHRRKDQTIKIYQEKGPSNRRGWAKSKYQSGPDRIVKSNCVNSAISSAPRA